ncbi:MAG: class I SAM-dependent methyltransferase [Deltaproteobacteria bacterium]|nr:class I SAM-dependent methyltransferase [Deltaproteobacteria bacterium]MBW2725614.1 class I SAM-dependent methyltransferase [Deltaproteobacteria bacterium]
MSIESYRRHFFEALHEYKDDSSGESLYEDANRLHFHEAALPFLEALPTDFSTLIDVGCGCGYDSRWFSRNAKEVTAITSHPTPAQLAFAARNGFEMRHMDMHALEFEDASVDAILCKHCLEHAFSPLGALFEMRRVLKPGGYLFLVVPPHHEQMIESGHFTQGWSIGQMAYCLAVAGFDARDGAYRKRRGNVEGVVRKAPEIPRGRGLYEVADRLPEAIQELQRDEWHGGFPRDQFEQIRWPYAGAERQTIMASARSSIERVSLRDVIKNRVERKLPGGRWISKLL